MTAQKLLVARVAEWVCRDVEPNLFGLTLWNVEIAVSLLLVHCVVFAEHRCEIFVFKRHINLLVESAATFLVHFCVGLL